MSALPDWVHVKGRCAWYVYQGPYYGLPDAWQKFMRRVHAKGLEGAGPPGDVYICDPAEHQADDHARLLTLFWAPLK